MIPMVTRNGKRVGVFIVDELFSHGAPARGDIIRGEDGHKYRVVTRIWSAGTAPLVTQLRVTRVHK